MTPLSINLLDNFRICIDMLERIVRELAQANENLTGDVLKLFD